MLRHLLVLTLAFTALAAPAREADVDGAKDHPLISRFTGARIAYYKVSDFDEAVLPVKPIANADKVPADAVTKVEGKVTRTLYELPAGKTLLEVMRNYAQALGGTFKPVFQCAGDASCGAGMESWAGNGGQVVPTGWNARFGGDNRLLVARRAAPSGDVWVLLYAMKDSTDYPPLVYQEVIEVRAMATGQVKVLDAESLRRGLDTDGRVAVYGVLFDTAKAEIKPESKPSLDQMVKLLKAHPALKVFVVGHTDNAGSLAANLDLSQRRADAVVNALVAQQIDAKRLTGKGVASLAPVAPNTNEAGRALNRRVELVVQ